MGTLRNYLTIEELQKYANIEVTDEEEAYENIEMAEEAIDAYVGPQDRWTTNEYMVRVTEVNGLEIIDTSVYNQMDLINGFYTGMVVEVVGGTGVGQMRRIASSSRTNKSITIADAFETDLDTTSVLRIYQLGKFPRCKDVVINTEGTEYYKVIPMAVKRAVAAQMAYMISKGEDFFNSDESDKQSERIGNYSYSKGGNASGSTTPISLVKMVSPKARNLLNGIMNRKGRLL